jgi:hypothetical protein
VSEITGLVSVFFCGSAGVLVVEGAKIATAYMASNARQQTRRYRTSLYWIGLCLLLLLAGFVTVVTIGAGPVKFITALQIAINAPALITAWATASQRNSAAKRRTASLELAPDGQNKIREVEDTRSFSRRLLEEQSW